MSPQGVECTGQLSGPWAGGFRGMFSLSPKVPWGFQCQGPQCTLTCFLFPLTLPIPTSSASLGLRSRSQGLLWGIRAKTLSGQLRTRCGQGAPCPFSSPGQAAAAILAMQGRWLRAGLREKPGLPVGADGLSAPAQARKLCVAE